MPLTRILLLLAVFACSLTADTEYVVKTNFDGHENIVRHYLRGKAMRTEEIATTGNARHITILSFENHAMYQVDETARQYTEMGGPDLIANLAARLTRVRAVRESGKIVNIYFEMIDTGERRQMFGFTARHMVFHERHVAEPGACSENSEIDRDGWYASPRSSTARSEYGTFLLASVSCSDTVIMHGHPANPGMALEEKTTTRYTNPAGPDRILFESKEIVEFSNDPLDESLFEVPRGFQRVGNTNWSEHLAYDWGQLEHAFSSWFD
jgi:hypothetical protein